MNMYDHLSDAELISLLFTEADTLPRVVVDEFIKRGARMIELLRRIIAEEYYWQSENKDQWAVIHATFILGAIGTKDVITPLIMSMRYADRFDCDWLWETIPSMFGKIGIAALDPLRSLVLDRSNCWETRNGAFDGMVAITISVPTVQRSVLDLMASILNDKSEDRMLRGMAGSTLLDFCADTYQESLLEFAQEEELLADDPNYIFHFDTDYVRTILTKSEKQLKQYTRDWLDFYDSQEIEARQRRWTKENSWFAPIIHWWEMRKAKQDMKLLLQKELYEKK